MDYSDMLLAKREQEEIEKNESLERFLDYVDADIIKITEIISSMNKNAEKWESYDFTEDLKEKLEDIIK